MKKKIKIKVKRIFKKWVVKKRRKQEKRKRVEDISRFPCLFCLSSFLSFLLKMKRKETNIYYIREEEEEKEDERERESIRIFTWEKIWFTLASFDLMAYQPLLVI